MNLRPEIQEEFYNLMGNLREGDMTPSQKVRLDELLGQHPALQQAYVDYILLWHELRCFQPMSEVEHAGVARHMDIAAIEREAQRRLDRFLAEQEETRKPQQQRPEPRFWPDLAGTVLGFFQWFTSLYRLVAGGVVLTALLLLSFFVFRYVQAASVLGTLGDSMNARWEGDLGGDIPKGAALHAGRVQLSEGYARIVFGKGAGVWIEAPAEFILKSKERMVLNSGRLFANVPLSARGFRVDTPHATIVDLGTQFGVTAEASGASDLHLFKGKASLTTEQGIHAGRSEMLTGGQARSVDQTAAVKDIRLQEGGFVRRFCAETGFVWRGERLSLADLTGRGNGLGAGPVNVFVDPVNGYVDSAYSTGQGNEYHPLASHPFVNGLFIPNGESKQVVSTQGHVFAECPATNGECYTSLGANPNQRVWTTDKRSGTVRFDGQDYGDRDHPCLMMHANLGITFDLKAVRTLCPDLQITRFVSRTAVADFNEVAGCNADFWVLVDGHVRYSRPHVTDKGVLANLSIELAPTDRFLTLVTTDGGDADRAGAYQKAYTCDWCVFVEPALIVAPE
jgi:hypothetical protein